MAGVSTPKIATCTKLPYTLSAPARSREYPSMNLDRQRNRQDWTTYGVGKQGVMSQIGRMGICPSGSRTEATGDDARTGEAELMEQGPTKSVALRRLRNALAGIPELTQLRHGSPTFKKWRRKTDIAITKTFGSNTRHTHEFSSLRYSQSDIVALTARTPDPYQEAYLRGLESANALLESMIEEIEEYWKDGEQAPRSAIPKQGEPTNANKIFIIHGRDEGTKDKVARFVESLKLTPVVLAEQASHGRTIIEKLEEHSQVGFAVALLTPDDTGSLKGAEDNPRPRARQNVLFEFGFFIGSLSRSRVCALTDGDVEIPSDYAGVVYIPLKQGNWKLDLAKELKKAGLSIDLNDLVS